MTIGFGPVGADSRREAVTLQPADDDRIPDPHSCCSSICILGLGVHVLAREVLTGTAGIRYIA